MARHARATRVGLTMRQRIARLSGSLQVESEPGGGTAVSACVPTATSLVAS